MGRENDMRVWKIKNLKVSDYTDKLFVTEYDKEGYILRRYWIKREDLNVKGRTMIAIPNIKPCPFCNGNAEVKDRYRKGVANRKMYWVECKKCGVSQAHHGLAGYRTPNKAIAVWNHRW